MPYWDDHHVAEVMHHLRRGMRRVMGEPMGPEWEHTSAEDREAMMAEVSKGSPMVTAVKRALPDTPKEPVEDYRPVVAEAPKSKGEADGKR